MTLDGDGYVVLVDYGNRRIVTLSPEGRLLREVPLAIDAGYVSGVAVLQSNHYVMATDGAAPWILVNQEGQQVQEVESPRALAQLSFAGSTRGQLHLLDRYDLQTGDYLNSLVLPQPVKHAAVGSQGTVFVVTYDLFPTVMALRPSPSLSLRGLPLHDQSARPRPQPLSDPVGDLPELSR